VSNVTGYGLDDRDSIPDRSRTFSLKQCPDHLWGPISLLSNKYRE